MTEELYQQPDTRKPSLAPIFLLGLGMMLIFWLATKYMLGSDPGPADEEALRGMERMEIWKAHLEEENTKIGSFAWVDRDAGLVSIPLDRAMELTLASYAEIPAEGIPAYPINAAALPVDPTPVEEAEVEEQEGAQSPDIVTEEEEANEPVKEMEEEGAAS
jgi:hypothetical protein